MNNYEQAVNMVKNGFQCSQATLAVLGRHLGIEHKQVLRLASGFGGGIARQGDICGAISGAIMAIGLKHGYEEAPNIEAREKVFFLTTELLKRIRAKYGCYNCRDLTGYEWTGPESSKLFHELGIPEKVCHKVIRDTIEIVQEIW